MALINLKKNNSMPQSFSYREHFQNVEDKVDSLSADIVEKARNFYCSLYNDTPQWVLRRNPLVSPLVRKGLERMCHDQLPPPPPLPLPFIGGQCCDVTYEVTVRVKIVMCLNYEVKHDRISAHRITGKIVGGKIGVYPVQSQLSGAWIEYEDCSGNSKIKSVWSATFDATSGNCLVQERTHPLADNISIDQSSCEILGIAVVAGDDNCGDPPGGYPPVPPPSDDDIRRPFDITYEDNSTRTIIYNINRDPSGNIFFPPVINAGGVSVHFDVAGICVGCVNRNTPSGGGGAGGSSGLTGDGGQEEEAEEEVLEEEEDGGEEDVPKIKAVKVDVTQIGSPQKTQFGNGSPDIIWAGWLEFKIDDSYAPRTRIDFARSYFIAPEGATGFAYCLKTGFKAKITVIKEKTEDK